MRQHGGVRWDVNLLSPACCGCRQGYGQALDCEFTWESEHHSWWG